MFVCDITYYFNNLINNIKSIILIKKFPKQNLNLMESQSDIALKGHKISNKKRKCLF